MRIEVPQFKGSQCYSNICSRYGPAGRNLGMFPRCLGIRHLVV